MSVALPAVRGYRMVQQIGEGAMGRVFLAEDEALGRRVAIKMITPGRAGDGDARARFLREARAMAGVEHPHVVRVHALGETEGQPYLVMEYVNGETLAGHLARLGVLRIDDALRITREVAQALAAAWRLGIVHRDVKPANILLDADDHAKVADFGLARSTDAGDADLTGSGFIVGTPHYISPEQARGEPPDFRSDVYSLGLVLYEMLAGEKPFKGRSPGEVIARQLTEALPPLSATHPEIPPAVDELVRSMTAKRAADRPPSYPDLLRQIGASDGSAVPQPTESDATATRRSLAVRRPSRRRFRVLAALVALAAILTVAFLALRAPRRHGSFAVAVAPFHAPDAASEREGLVMVALLESELRRRLPEDDVDVFGAGDVGKAVRSPRGAKAVADRLQADIVVWGDALAFGDEVAVAPHISRRDGTVLPDEASAPLRSTGTGGIEARRARAAALADRVLDAYTKHLTAPKPGP